ncbi:MAG: hypothetical protein NTX52_06165 [Planctomycetota bacterium]|nr:hypothetical protein [Planctomycetota bacterium]
MTGSYCVVRIASPLRQAPYFALNDRASDFAKATPDKSQGKQGRLAGLNPPKADKFRITGKNIQYRTRNFE